MSGGITEANKKKILDNSFGKVIYRLTGKMHPRLDKISITIHYGIALTHHLILIPMHALTQTNWSPPGS